MHRTLVVLGLILCLYQHIQAQSKAPTSYSTSKMDSLSRLFDATKDDAAKIKVVANAPKRIDEYFEKPALILQLYQKALSLAQRIGDEKSLINLLIEIAYLEMYAMIDEPRAFQLYTQALGYTEAEKDYASSAKICYELAVITEHQNAKDEMYNYLFKSVEYTEKSSVLFLKPYEGLKIMFLEDNRVNEALSICQKCIQYVNDRNAPVASKLFAYGYMLELLNKLPNKKREIDEYTKKIRSLLEQIDIDRLSDISYNSIATICYEAREYKLAIYYASQIFKKSDLDNRTRVEQDLCAKIISESYERLKQYDESLRYYKLHAQIYLRNTRNRLSIESGRKVIRAESERNLILKQKEIDQERFYRNLSVAIAAFILMLGGIIFLFYRREQNRKRELIQLNATKDKLVAILSHDLYSPITNLQNNVALTDWGALSQPEFTQQVGQLGNQLAHVRNLLDNTLTWVLSQMNGLLPVPKLLDLYELVENEILAQQVTATTKQIIISNQVPTRVRVQADENHLIVIIRNLLQNALKFTQPGGLVVVTYAQNNNQQQIQLRDTGLGMSPERLATLFTLGQGTSARGTANERGTGLGLVLVKELMEANGGQIEVASQPGVGTTFTLRFAGSRAKPVKKYGETGMLTPTI